MAAPHPTSHDRLLITPPLAPDEREVLDGLAGTEETAHRIWAGQPGPRSPWRPCASGCCLVLGGRRGEATTWLRFLVREVLAPRSVAARDRATRAGLVAHQLDGDLDLGPSGALRVRGTRVTERAAARSQSPPRREVVRPDDPGPAS